MSPRFIPAARAVAILAGFLLAGLANADDRVGELMHRLAGRGGGHARFVERQYLALLKAPVESSGELVFVPPDHLEKRTTAPKAESLVIDKGQLTLERGGRRRTVSLAAYPQLGAFIESIRATLAGDRESLEAIYGVSLTGGESDWTLALTPRDARLAKVVRAIRISGRADLLQGVEIQRVDGDRSVMTISDPTAG